MREATIEAYLKQRVEYRGGLCLKFVSPGRKNVPDRIVLMPAIGGFTAFVELKAPGKRPTQGQLREHDRLRGFGFMVRVIDSKESVDAFLDSL